MSQPPAPRKLRVRGMILTGGVAAITVVGTFVGAALKSDQETKTTKKKEVARDVAYELDMISTLETRRAGLVQARQQWEKKAKALQDRTDGNKLRTIPGIGRASMANSTIDGSASSGK